jgi:uncharacterized membrane protein YbhN (UPF0104 family)
VLAEPANRVAVLAAAVAYTVAMLLSMAAWRALVLDAGHALPARAAARIFFVGVLAKFAPGRLWTLATNIRMGRAAGIGAASMTGIFVSSTAIGMLTGATAGLLAAPAVLGDHGWWLLAPAVLVGAAIARPDLLDRAARALARLARRPVPAPASRSGVRRALLAQLLSWLAAGMQLWILAAAFGAPPWPAMALCVGAFGLANIAGSLAVFTPDGLGVRELLIAAPLAGVVGWSHAAVVAVLSRLVCTLVELLLPAGVLALAHPRLSLSARH